jgi:hypothetical protein
MGAPARVAGCVDRTGVLVGTARADITPVKWPVAMAAYSINRTGDGAVRPFYARSIAIRSCATGETVVLTALDSQGYFAGYKEDPGPGAAGYGTTAIRLTVSRATGIPFDHLMVASTHTHNSPDSIGLWGGSVTANNKGPYLSLVKARTVASMEAAVHRLRPATFSVGVADVGDVVSTASQVQDDPKDYPVDHWIRVLQARDRDHRVVATVVDAGIHATVAGELPKISPDWPGRVADDLDARYGQATTVVFAGALGRTGPRLPARIDHGSDVTKIKRYGDLLVGRVDQALRAAEPVLGATVGVVDTTLAEDASNPVVAALFTDETGTPPLHGVMRSITPPFQAGPIVNAEVQTIRIGNVLVAGAPGEAYPEVGTELARRIHRAAAVFPITMANDQVGYTPPAFEWPVVALLDTGDEGVFTINIHFGDDVINQQLDAAHQLGFPTDTGYDGFTAGPVYPPGSTPGTGPA